MTSLLAIVLSLHVSAAPMGGGADSLLETLGSKSGKKTGESKGISLQDSFSAQFFSLWQNETKPSYELNAWATKILSGKYAEAAHLWTSIQHEIKPSFVIPSKAAYLYLLWKLGATQTFFEEWMNSLSDPKFRDSRIALALDQTIAPNFDRWILKEQPFVSAENAGKIQTFSSSRGPLYLTLKALTALRTGETASPIMQKLPANHALKAPISETVMLAKARRGDLRGAASVMKQHLEPAIEETQNPEALSFHYLQVGRLLYQAGSLDGSKTFYERVPKGAPDYLAAREELLWVWLRLGDLGRLRGELASFQAIKSPDDPFIPDSFVVRSISNLKLCYYDQVEENLKSFVEANRKWASSIEAALKVDSPPRPEPEDFYSREASVALKNREAEVKYLESLGEESIGATLPAVGPQKHWANAATRLKRVTELSKKNLAQEYRRQWKNRGAILKEAIHKMRFVKVEYLSQIRALSQKDETTSSNEKKRIQGSSVAAVPAPDGEVVFPFDGVVWPDELFKIRSVAVAQCLKGVK